MTTSTGLPRIALITGGSRGLGHQAALSLAERGVGSVLTYQHNRAQADQTVDAIKALGVHAVALQLDSGAHDSFTTFADQLRDVLQRDWHNDHITYLLNNAGMGSKNNFASTTEAEFDQLMNVHLKGVFFLTQALLPMIADGGAILNVSSGLTRFTQPGAITYATMKGAVETLTKYLAQELGPRRIRVNVIAPGAIATDFGGGTVRDNAQVNAFLASQTALGRVGLPGDIGPAIAALLSDDLAWMTAQRIEVSGGMFL